MGAGGKNGTSQLDTTVGAFPLAIPGFTAAEILYTEAGAVRGVATGHVGLGKDGQPTDNFQLGMELNAKYTLFAEGARGHLGKQLIQRFALDKSKDTQTFAIGIKELWEVDPALAQPGLVVHTSGWPIADESFGGGFLYHLEDNKVTLGFVLGLDYTNPYMSPFEEMQRWKTHPAIRAHLEGGKRIGYGREIMAPHSLTLTLVGTGMLWVGWFGFNAGSALEANGVAALAFVNTFLATAAAVLSWSLAEWLGKGKPSMLGGASGAVAGLVAITPAAGLVGLSGALIIGAIAGVVCLWGVTGWKKLLRADDSLDVFGVHGVGGITGALLTGVFAAPQLGGTGLWDYVTESALPEYSIATQVWIQTQGVLVTIALSGVVALAAFLIVKHTVGLRVNEEAEREGLDISSHGESAYEL